jgi:Smr domain
MRFPIGSRVRLRFTNESGIVVAYDAIEQLVQVRLDGDPTSTIPVFEDDLLGYAAPTRSAVPPPGIKSKAQPTAVPPQPREIKASPVAHSVGLQLAFEQMPGRDGSVTQYQVWLLNDGLEEYVVVFDLFVGDQRIAGTDTKIGAGTALEVGTMLHDHLNDIVEAECDVRRITTQGLEDGFFKTIRIKAKQFLNNLQHTHILNVAAHVYVLSAPEEAPKIVAKEAVPDALKQYAKQQAKKVKEWRSSEQESTPFSSLYKAFNVEEYATFEPEIDLHIDKLTSNHEKLNNSEMIQVQLLHFERFMEKAVRLGVPSVFVIHGVGKGVLRDLIAQSLRNNPHVISFHNQYHKKYGYGATEVVLM